MPEKAEEVCVAERLKAGVGGPRWEDRSEMLFIFQGNRDAEGVRHGRHSKMGWLDLTCVLWNLLWLHCGEFLGVINQLRQPPSCKK